MKDQRMKMRAIDPTEPLGQAALFGRPLQGDTGSAEEHELKKRLRFEGLLSTFCPTRSGVFR